MLESPGAMPPHCLHLLPAVFLLLSVFPQNTGFTPVFHQAPKPLSEGSVTSDWPDFLGPTRDMVSRETGLLRSFTNGEPRLVWEMEKGEGYAAPAIAEGRLVFAHRIAGEVVVDCLDAQSGARLWQFRYATSYDDRYGYNGGPRSSPVISGKSVFIIGPEGALHRLDFASGKVRWRRRILEEFRVAQNFFGIGSTPLVCGSFLIVNVGGAKRGDAIAFDLETGNLAWESGVGWGASYASPVRANFMGTEKVLLFAGGESSPPTGGLLCLDPVTGRIDFALPWRGRSRESVNASTPLVLGNRVFLSECYGAGSVLLEWQARGATRIVWTNRGFGIHFMTPVVKDGFLYGVDGHGPGNAFLVCLDLKDGAEKWRAQPNWEEEIARDGKKERVRYGTFRSWFLSVDGRFLCLGEFGHLLWYDLTPAGPKELSRVWLFAARETWTPPVLSHGLLYVCQNQRDYLHGKAPRLLCYDIRN
jgi:outer membrane protein assembly factor BamB